MTFFCTHICPNYQLGMGKKWPPEGSINHNTILQLDLFYSKEGKWSDIPYMQVFFALSDKLECVKNAR